MSMAIKMPIVIRIIRREFDMRCDRVVRSQNVFIIFTAASLLSC